MNELTAQDKIIVCNALLRLFGTDVLTSIEKRDVLNEITEMITGFNVNEIISDTVNQRKLCVKRGTTTQNQNYTGLVGEITMDTNVKTLCVHDGETIGGTQLARISDIPEQTVMPENYDFVIESATGLSNNGWYRKYKSGWVEQGGIVTSPFTQRDIWTLPVVMSDSNYSVIAMAGNQTANNNSSLIGIYERT